MTTATGSRLARSTLVQRMPSTRQTRRGESCSAELSLEMQSLTAEEFAVSSGEQKVNARLTGLTPCAADPLEEVGRGRGCQRHDRPL